MRAQVNALADLDTDLDTASDTWHNVAESITPKLTARGWMQPASSQETPSGMCGAMSAGRAENLATVSIAWCLIHGTDPTDFAREPTQPGAPQYFISTR
jgi:hypothetical protein